MSDKLNKLLANARPATEAELQAQRESWVRGEMAIGLDRDEVKWGAELFQHWKAETGRYFAKLERLRGYVDHKEPCPKTRAFRSSADCDCGLSELLKEIDDDH